MASVDRPGPPRGQDPAGRGDASRARLRGAQHQAPRRRHVVTRRRRGAVPRRAVRPPGRHDRPDRRSPAAAALLIFLGVASVVVDRRPAGHRADRLAGRQAVRHAGRAGPRERRAGAAAHLGTAAALMIGVALVSAAAVFASSLRDTFVEHPRPRRHRRLHRHRRVVPGALAADVADTLSAVPELSAVTAVRGAGQAQRRRRRPEGVRRRRPGWRSRSSSTSTCIDGRLRRPRRRRHLRPQGPGQGPRPAGRRHGRPSRSRTAPASDAAGGRHLRRRLARRQLADLARHARAGGAGATSARLLRRRQARRRRDPEQGDAAVEAAMAPFPQAKVQTNAEFRKTQEAQIDQLLVVITVLLAFAIVIAVLGISITLGARRVRADAGDRAAAGRRHEQAPDPPHRCAGRRSSCRRSGRSSASSLGTLIGVALSLAVPDTRDRPASRSTGRSS